MLFQKSVSNWNKIDTKLNPTCIKHSFFEHFLMKKQAFLGRFLMKKRLKTRFFGRFLIVITRFLGILRPFLGLKSVSTVPIVSHYNGETVHKKAIYG